MRAGLRTRRAACRAAAGRSACDLRRGDPTVIFVVATGVLGGRRNGLASCCRGRRGM